MQLTQEDLLVLIDNLVKSGATELHLKVPKRPQLRIGQDLVDTTEGPVDPQGVLRLATLICALARVEVPLATITHHEFSFGIPGKGRFHTILYRQRGSIAVQLRKLAFGARPLEELGLNLRTVEAVRGPGLYLICGDRRRRDVLAALVEHLNQTRRGLIVVVEDPLHALHRDGMSTIVQRGVGTDVPTMAHGIRSAIRQDADVIALGDVCNRETAEAVLRAAESEALVLATVAAPQAVLAASWIQRHYTNDRDMDNAHRVKRVLRGVISLAHGEGARLLSNKASRAA